MQAELAHDEREAAELAGVTWQPEISKMAQTLQRPDAEEDSFMRLTRTRTNKTQVGHTRSVLCCSCPATDLCVLMHDASMLPQQHESVHTDSYGFHYSR